MKKLLLLIFVTFITCAANANKNIDIGEIQELKSNIMKESRTIQVHIPESYKNSNKKYPVLYLTDGPSQFHHTVGTVNFLARNNRIPEMIIVGVANTKRTRDLTPTVRDVNRENFADGGGADKFLSFFEKELIPLIEEKYRTQPFRVFSGHSFGGIFAINAFMKKPELFNAFISISPSLWWDAERLIEEAPVYFTQNQKHNSTLFVTMAAEGERMLAPYEKFIKVMKANSVEDGKWAAKEFDDEDHGSTVLRSQYFGLLHTWKGWHVSRELINQGLPALKSHFDMLSKRFAYTVQIPEAMINNVGYQTLGKGEHEQAIKIFKYNIDLYPNSANVYDSLGDAFEAKGDFTAANKSYAKALSYAADNDPNKAFFKANMERSRLKMSKISE